MSSIKVNTELLKNNNDTLNSIKKYYSDKKSSFSSGYFNGNYTINNYLNRILNSYSEIANNINEVSKYLKDYYEDIENMENNMSGNGGSVKASGVNGIINGKSNFLNKFSIEDGIIFEIIGFSTEGYKANINTGSTINNSENSSSSQKKVNQTNTPTLESIVADQIGSGGMVFDFISGGFVPTGASVTSSNYSLEAYDELANLYSEMGFSDSEVEELMACLNDEEAFMNKILEIENRKLSDPEQRRVIYENNILADYAEFFQTNYGEEFSSLEELAAAIEGENLKIEELKGKQQANLFTSDVLSTLLSRSNEAVKSLTGDTTVVWAFLGDDGLVHYSFMDPSQFMVVENGVIENANLDEFKGKNMYNPKAYTLDEILSMCDSDGAASFRSLLAGNEINEDAKNEVITKLSSIQDDVLKEVEKKNTYQQIYDEVASAIDYQLNYIDEYTYKEDFANNIEVSSESLDKVNDLIKRLEATSETELASGEICVRMSREDTEEIATLLYAYYNDLGNITYDGNLFYVNGAKINGGVNTNLTFMDYVKYKPFLNESELEVLNYIYNTEGEAALFEWLKSIGNEVDSRYLNAEEAKDEAFAQEHNILGTIASFDYSDAIVGTLKSIWATVTNQGIKDSYTYDSSSTYRNVVGSCLGDRYGSWASKAYNIGVTASDQLIWAPVHVLSGGTTAALPAMFLTSRSMCSAIGEAKARGFSDWESLASGGASGLFTFLTEHASASHLLHLDDIAEKEIAPFLYEAFGDHKVLGKTIGTAFALNSQALFEVEEEELEEILGNITDKGLSHLFGHQSQSELDYQALLDIYPPEVAKTKYREAQLNKYWDIAVETYLSTLLSSGGYMSLNTAYENSNRHDAKKLADILEDVRNKNSNNQTQTVKNENPGLALRDTLLEKVKGIRKDTLKIRKLYNELNKNLHYSVDYIIDGESLAGDIYTNELTFSDLKSDSVICKEWSELFREILIDAGIDPKNISIRGSDKQGSHKWVEIDMGDNIIIADGTESINGNYDDLFQSKAGSKTYGFVILPKMFSGYRLNNLYNGVNDNTNPKYQKFYDTFVKSIQESDAKIAGWDKKLGYLTEKGYYDANLSEAEQLFGGNDVVIEGIDTLLDSIFSSEIPEGMDTIEMSMYISNILENIHKSNPDFHCNLRRMYRHTDSGFECVLIISGLSSEGKNMAYVFSSNLGSKILNDQKSLDNYLHDNNIFNKKEMIERAKTGEFTYAEEIEQLDEEEHRRITEKITPIENLEDTVTLEITEELNTIDEVEDTLELDEITDKENLNEQTSILVEDRLIEAIGDSALYESIIKEIKTYNDNNLPDGYESVQELHEKIVDKLISTGKFDTLTDREIAFLIEDNYDIVEMLVNNDRFKKFVMDNLEALPGFYVKHFKSLSAEQLQAVFDNPQMAEFINSLSNEKFIKILSAFTGKDCQILCTDTFREKFLSIPFADLASLNYTSNNLYNFIKQCKDANDTGFINDLISKIETEGLNEGNLGYCYNLLRTLPVYGNFEIFKDVVKNKYLPEIRNSLKEALVKSSSVEIPDSFSEDGWYDITYIVDGKENVKSFNYSTKYPQEIIDYFYNYDEIASGKVNITSITKNNVKTNLDLHNIPTNGLNVITLEVDGQIEKIVGNVVGGNLSLASKFNGRDVKDVKVVSIEPFSKPSYNFNASSENAIYKVSYKLDDTMHVVYLSSEKLFTSASNGEVGLNYYIVKNNLYNISDIQIEELKVTKEMQDSLNIKRFKNSEDVFNSKEFGGRQNNIEDYIIDYFAGKEQSNIISKKCEELISIIKKYYPNATDTEIKNIVKSCASNGCAFMAMANSFITYMNGLPNGEELFREKMGYDLYTQDSDNKSFNTELLALDLFIDGNIAINKDSSIDSFIKNASGVSNMVYEFIAEDFFAKRGIKATPEIINGTSKSITSKLVQGYLNDPNNFLILCAKDFDLQSLSNTSGELTSDGALANAKVEGNITKGVGNHAMSVVEILDDGSIIVSSWGKKYKFLPTENTSSTNIYTLKFELEG